jgi:queuine tRNA-ribosyltransferase
MFSIVKSTAGSSAARLGRLSPPGRRPIDTPHFLANTSRGIVPHITQDTFKRDTNLHGVYVALEDCKSPRSELFNRPALADHAVGILTVIL